MQSAVITLASRNNQLWRSCCLATREATSRSANARQRYAKRSTACEKTRHIHGRPGTTSDRTRRTDLTTEGWSIAVGNTLFTPARVGNFIHFKAGARAASCINFELYTKDCSA